MLIFRSHHNLLRNRFCLFHNFGNYVCFLLLFHKWKSNSNKFLPFKVSTTHRKRSQDKSTHFSCIYFIHQWSTCMKNGWTIIQALMVSKLWNRYRFWTGLIIERLRLHSFWKCCQLNLFKWGKYSLSLTKMWFSRKPIL